MDRRLLLALALTSSAACSETDGGGDGGETDGGVGSSTRADTVASASSTSTSTGSEGADTSPGEESGGPPIDVPDYTGVYLREGLESTGGAPCEGPSRFEIVQRGDLLFVSARSTTCEDSPGPAGDDPIGPLIIGSDGTLYDRGRVAGELTEDLLSFSAISRVSGCVEGTVSLELRRVDETTFDYRDAASGCGQSVALQGRARVTEAPLVIPSLGSYQPVVAPVGPPTRVEVAFENVGNAPATDLSMLEIEPAEGIVRGFVGGSYPGAGGTCGAELGAGESCTVAVEVGASEPAVVSLRLQYDYADADDARAAQIELLAFTDPQSAIDVGVDQFLTAACILDASGAVECITGFDFEGEISLVPELSNPADLDVSSQGACAVDDAGLQCWGSLELSDFGGPGLAGLHYNNSLACARYAAAAPPACVSNGDSPSSLPEGVITDLATGGFGACFVSDGQLVCDVRESDFYEVPIPADLGVVTEVAVGTVWVCAQTDGGLRCFDKEGEAVVPGGLDTARELEISGQVACAEVQSDLRCWGSASMMVPDVGPLTALDLSQRIGCYAGPGGLGCFAPFVP